MKKLIKIIRKKSIITITWNPNLLYYPNERIRIHLRCSNKVNLIRSLLITIALFIIGSTYLSIQSMVIIWNSAKLKDCSYHCKLDQCCSLRDKLQNSCRKVKRPAHIVKQVYLSSKMKLFVWISMLRKVKKMEYSWRTHL